MRKDILARGQATETIKLWDRGAGAVRKWRYMSIEVWIEACEAICS